MGSRPITAWILTLLAAMAVSSFAHAATVVAGTSISSANVYLSCWNYSSYKYPWQNVVADRYGSFSFDRDATYGPCGSYYTGVSYTCRVLAHPYWGDADYLSATSSDFTPSCTESTTITLSHEKKNKILKVSLTTDGGDVITTGMTVHVSRSDGNSYDYSSTSSASNGVYELKTASGKYYVSAYCTNYYSDCDVSGSPNTYVTLSDSDTSQSVSLQFKANKSTLAVAVSDGKKGISGVYVSAYTYSGNSSTYTSGTSSYVYVSGQTNSDGGVTLKVPAGTYTVSLNPPYGSLYSSLSKEVTVGIAELLAVNMVLSSKNAPFTVTVKKGDGSGIKGAYVSGWTNDGGVYDSFYGQTNSSGIMTAYGVEGRKYQVSSYYWPPYENGVTTSKICNSNTEGYQTAKASTSGVSLEFNYPDCDNTVNVTAVDSSGAKLSVSYGWVEIKPAAQSSTDGSYSSTGISLTNGTGSGKVKANTKYIATLSIWDSTYIAGDPVTFTSGASDATTDVSLTLLSSDATINGDFVDASGTALSVSDVSYIYIYAVRDKAYRSCTINKGSFSCSVSEGNWCLGYWVDYNSGYVSLSPGASTQCYDVKAKETLTKNLTLLKTGKIIVSIKDPVGSALNNIWVEATATSVANYGSSKDNYYYGQGCMTASDGTCTISVGASDTGTTYYVNARTPYSIMSNNGWTHPGEESVTITAGGSGEVALSFGKPDGKIVIALAEGSATLSAKSMRAQKSVLKATGDDASIVDNATVDIFSNSGASATGETDSSGNLTLDCTLADTWYAVAHHIFGNTLYMSEATEFSCQKPADAASHPKQITIKASATLPECQSKTFDASVATTVGCTDGFIVSMPSGVIDTYGKTVNVSVTPVVTPFQKERPLSYYGWRVEATRETGEKIITLNGYVTLTCPCDTTQLEKVGLTLKEAKAKYYDPTLDAYKDVASTHSATKCEVTMTSNHFTDFVITGNGNLKGLDGTPEGVEPASEGSGASGGNSGSCGCRQGSGPVNLPIALMTLLPLLPAFFLRRLYRQKLRRDRST